MKKPTALKIMTLLLYGQYDYVQLSDDGQVRLAVGPFARHLQIHNSRLKEYLDWLAKWNYLEDLEFFHGTALFKVRIPDAFKKESING